MQIDNVNGKHLPMENILKSNFTHVLRKKEFQLDTLLARSFCKVNLLCFVFVIKKNSTFFQRRPRWLTTHLHRFESAGPIFSYPYTKLSPHTLQKIKKNYANTANTITQFKRKQTVKIKNLVQKCTKTENRGNSFLVQCCCLKNNAQLFLYGAIFVYCSFCSILNKFFLKNKITFKIVQASFFICCIY